MPYTPYSIVTLVNNHITPLNEEKRLIEIKGIYERKQGRAYSGVFYDNLKDEDNVAHKLTLKVPAHLRADLPNGQVVVFKGFISRRVSNYGSIDIQANIVELVQTQEREVSAIDLHTLRVLQLKSVKGFKDCDKFIRNKLYKSEPIKIGFLFGVSAITDVDVDKMWKGGRDHFLAEYRRVNFSNIREILQAVKKMDQEGFEIICLFRGGGNMEKFDNPHLAEGLVNMRPILITALGHGVDESLVRKISDKPLITPSALGTYLTNIVEEATDEFAASKARLVEETKKLISAQFHEKIKTLNTQLQGNTELYQKTLNEKVKLAAEAAQNKSQQYDKEVSLLNTRLNQLQRTHKETNQLLDQFKQQNREHQKTKERLKELENSSSVNWLWIVLAFLVGLVIAYVAFHH